MKIMVFDVPAESGGALSILYDFYNEFKSNKENEYIFVVSVPELVEASNIKILRFPWIKKSWGHRLYFDHFIAPKLVKKHKIDIIFSIQNVTIPHTNLHQSLFVHNALPFSGYRFSLKESKILWLYQNVIGYLIKKSIIKAEHVIVQTEWMRKKLIETLDIKSNKVEIKKPKIEIEIKEHFRETKENLSTFFYPASGTVFKNHKVIVEACLKLKEEGISDYKVVFTLSGDENTHIKELYNVVKDNHLPIEFAGSMHRDEVFQKYVKSILIFPSYIETVGLPLIEARLHNTPIIASSSDYSIEILTNYEKVHFFDPFSFSELSIRMKSFLLER